MRRMKGHTPRRPRVAFKRLNTFSSLDLGDVNVVIAMRRSQQFLIRTKNHQKGGSGVVAHELARYHIQRIFADQFFFGDLIRLG